ncbi:IscS subfamily cysteine desulfurase [Niabella terrae]
MKQVPIYMDYCATTACDPAVVEEMLPYFTEFFGNAASRIYSYGWQAAAAVEQATARVAALLHAQPREIFFTSGATEACNLAIRGIVEMYAIKGRHIISCRTEHKAVLDTCQALEKQGAELTLLPVDAGGRVDPEQLAAAIRPDTVLVAIMMANNETGVLQPVEEIGAICKQKQVLFFCDATQAAGKIPIDVETIQADLLCLSAHKIYGPKGVGALYIRSRNPRVKIRPQITGGGQQDGIRSGTQNVPGIVGLGKACAICGSDMDKEITRLTGLARELQAGIHQIPGTRLNGHPDLKLGHVLNFSFEDLNSAQLLRALTGKLAISAGSACTTGSLDPSYVLTAMGLEPALAKAALRFSIGRWTTTTEIRTALEWITETVAALRSHRYQG